MSLEDSAYEREFVSISNASGFSRNFRAWLALVSGKLNVLKSQSFSSGAQNWKVLRYQHVIHPEVSKYFFSNTEFVRPQTFAAHLRYLKNETNLVSLEDLLKAIDEDSVEPGTVALTFDGGYLDQYQNASELLIKNNIPATFFLATAFIDTMFQPWRKMLVSSMQLLRDEGFPYPLLEGYFGDELLSKLEEVSPDRRITDSVITLIVDYLKEQPLERREFGLRVFEELTVDLLGGLPSAQVFMTWDNVKELSQNNISFGSYGHSMVPFSQLGAEALKKEIRDSLLSFKEDRVDPITVFSLPEGEVNSEAQKELSDLGIKFALGLGDYDVSKNIDKLRILGRVNMYQQASDTVGAFAARVWNLKIGSYLY